MHKIRCRFFVLVDKNIQIVYDWLKGKLVLENQSAASVRKLIVYVS